MVKCGFILGALLFLSAAALGQGRTSCELTVRVSYENPMGKISPVRVQVLSENRTPITDTYTREDGNATFAGIPAGNFFVRVTGMDIEDAMQSFSIYARQTMHTEFVQIRLKASREPKSSSSPSVSAATLNIPEKARKEFEKGMQAMNENKLPDADKHFSKALEQYPRYAAAWNARGVVDMKSNKPAEAHTMFQSAIDADKDFSLAYVNLGRLLVSEKKNVEAESILTKATSLDPRDPGALSMLANLNLSMGKLDDAIANARKAHDLPHADYPLVHLIAGMALEQKQLDAEAAAEFRQFLQESPHSPSVDRIHAELDAIEKRLR